MDSPLISAKPSVLRCGRCGRFVDWADARLQLVCGCRSHVDLPPVDVHPCADEERQAVLDLFQRDFGSTRIGAFDAEHALVDMPTLVAIMKKDGELAGALAYRLTDSTLQMLALATDPMWQRSGVGGHLVEEAERVALAAGLTTAEIATSNDNLPALYFYQRHGYHISSVSTGKLIARAAGRPGFAGIAVRDEIHLEKALRPQS
jgi:ribosomal protein S18 acetylase RimI-like enzyme